MNLSISNIAWNNEQDIEMYEYLQKEEIRGLEIAPTRIFTNNPYDNLEKVRNFSENLLRDFNLTIVSMQSIWFGKTENLFGTDKERENLFNYTKKAINFASAAGCGNLVFGCPKNRTISNMNQYDTAIDFFKSLGDYAWRNNTVVSIEPNPPIYNTNFINTTQQAFELSKCVDSKGFLVNIDLGTIIYNCEDIALVNDNITRVNHIHISEPYLENIQVREMHKELKKLNYKNYFSIEMKNNNNIDLVKKVINYVKGVLF